MSRTPWFHGLRASSGAAARGWYNDWAETFRQELSYHQLRRLGLISIKLPGVVLS